MCENLTTKEAAKYLGLSLATLKKWRQRKQGLSYLKLGSRVFYELKELDKFLVNCKISKN